MGKRAVFRLFYYISIALTLVLAGVTLAGVFAEFVSPGKAIGLAFIGLAMPILLLLNMAVVIYWAIRWRIWVIVPVIAILGNWGYLSRVIRFASPDTAEKPTLTIATYNVDAFSNEQSGYTCKNIAEYMESQGADIVCMQEFGMNKEFNEDSTKVAFGAWPYSSIPKPEDGKPILQVALFSKYPILSTELVTYPDSKNCSMYCDLDINGKTVRVFNNHLQTTEVTSNKRKLEKQLKSDNTVGTETAAIGLAEGLKKNFIERAAQSENIRRLVNASPHPTLVCGDFNSIPASYTYRVMKGNMLQDGFQMCGHGYMYTFRYFKHLLRIDYILPSKEFKGVDYFSPDLPYSDHNPVIMKVKL